MKRMKLLIDIPEWKYKSICEGIEASKRCGVVGIDPDIHEAIANGTPIKTVTNAEETEDYPINQEENCNIVCDFLRDITGVDIRKGKKHQVEWIPVNERLPEQANQSYLVTVDYGEGLVCSCQRFFFSEDLGWNDDCVIAWQPLPEPYQKGGAE